MVIEVFGLTIHDPDVVFTDLGLAVLGSYLGWRLWSATDRPHLLTAGAVLMFGLASAALWGAIFHAFFPNQTATPAGFIVWLPVAFSILVVAATLLDLALKALTLVPSFPRRVLVGIYAVAFAGVILLVDESFATIVRFYVPALVLFLVAAARLALKTRTAAWTLIVGGFTMSALAAVLQQVRVALHPVYFDHNAVYHVLQGGALVLIYFGFRRGPELLLRGHAPGTDPATRPE